MIWTQADAVQMCVEIESVCPSYGCHVALTGGLLYKSGKRKDADVVLYRIRQVEKIDLDGLFVALKAFQVVRLVEGEHWCIKGTWRGRPVDFFVPDFGGEYADGPPPSLADDVRAPGL